MNTKRYQVDRTEHGIVEYPFPVMNVRPDAGGPPQTIATFKLEAHADFFADYLNSLDEKLHPHPSK